MRFLLVTTGTFYQKEQKTKLETLGFEFSDYDNGIIIHQFKKTNKEIFIEMDSLQELVDFSNKWGQIIINGDVIEIYDDYRE